MMKIETLETNFRVPVKKSRLKVTNTIHESHAWGTRTPARIALKEACRVIKKKPGRKANWIDTIKNDLKRSNLSINTNSNEVFFNELEVREHS